MANLYELKYVYESKIGGEHIVNMGLFDNRELVEQKAKESAYKLVDMLKLANSMYHNVKVELFDNGDGSYEIETNRYVGCKEWHTILIKNYQANEMEYQIEDLLGGM